MRRAVASSAPNPHGNTEISLEPLSFATRLWLAFILPWQLLFDGVFAARVQRLGQAGELPASETNPELAAAKLDDKTELTPEPEPAPVVETVTPEADMTAALQLLTILQREGRFIDFLQEDVSGASDADIGAAARVVYEGCKRGLAEYVNVAPIRAEEEGAAVQLEPGYDASETRITGKVTGEPPFKGTLAHHGWRATSIRLPKLSADHDPHIIAPAEVEL